MPPKPLGLGAHSKRLMRAPNDTEATPSTSRAGLGGYGRNIAISREQAESSSPFLGEMSGINGRRASLLERRRAGKEQQTPPNAPTPPVLAPNAPSGPRKAESGRFARDGRLAPQSVVSRKIFLKHYAM